MKQSFKILLPSILLLLATAATAQVNSLQLSVAVEAAVQEQPPRITLSWLKDDSAVRYTVWRFDTNTLYWSQQAVVGSSLSWTDTNVAIGIPYEYQVTKTVHTPVGLGTGYGYAYTGIDVPAQESSGTVDLIVDDTFASGLSMELSRYVGDLANDGWRVIRHDVKRSASVESVKALILRDMEQDTSVHTLFLFGHVPVPYSGFLNPDGHPTHYGAWPADVYYGDTTMEWTDEESDTNALHSAAPNVNVPGDGKFDQSNTEEVDLQIGRVDFWNMPAFSLSEEELLRQYLNKDHAFRIGTLKAPRRALVSDNFGTYGEGFASSAWRNFANLVGGNNIHQLDWFSTLDTAYYLWAYGCGGGDYTDASGVGSTTDFATKGTNAIFTMLFGSWFGDWNDQNNFLRAPLADATTLTCCWGGRPQWYFDHMAMGYPIGEAAQITQNAPIGGLYEELPYSYVLGVHIALMGDPTLRMSYSQAASNFVSFSAQHVGAAVQIQWQTSHPADGFNVYRANHWNDMYTRLNSVPIASYEWTDSLPFTDSNYYEVRIVSKMGNLHGTYYAVGQPSNPVVVANSSDVANAPEQSRSIRIANDGPFLTAIVNYDSNEPSRLAIYDMTGREIRLLDGALHGIGEHAYTLDTRSANGWVSGVYFVRLLSESGSLIAKFVIAN